MYPACSKCWFPVTFGLITDGQTKCMDPAVLCGHSDLVATPTQPVVSAGQSSVSMSFEYLKMSPAQRREWIEKTRKLRITKDNKGNETCRVESKQNKSGE